MECFVLQWPLILAGMSHKILTCQTNTYCFWLFIIYADIVHDLNSLTVSLILLLRKFSTSGTLFSYQQRVFHYDFRYTWPMDHEQAFLSFSLVLSIF